MIHMQMTLHYITKKVEQEIQMQLYIWLYGHTLNKERASKTICNVKSRINIHEYANEISSITTSHHEVHSSHSNLVPVRTFNTNN